MIGSGPGISRKKVFTPGVVIGALVVCGAMLILMLSIISWSRPTKKPLGKVTTALTIIPMPTSTKTPIPTKDIPEILGSESHLPPGGEFNIGAFVKIHGTDGAGLRLRINPGLESEPLFLGLEDEIFKIEDGPRESDGYKWWYLVAPFDPSRNGWGVSNYLETVQDP